MRKIDICKKNLLLLIIISLFIMTGCFNNNTTRGTLSGIIQLEGNQDYSGIVVSVPGTSLSTSTGENGNYSLSNVPAGASAIIITKSGYASHSETVVITAGQTTILGTITLSSRYGGISGIVILEGDVNYSGITVSVDGTGFSTTTNAQGEYNLSNVFPDTVTLNFSKSGYSCTTAIVTIVEGATTNVSTVTLDMSPSFGSITGTVKISGTLTSGVTVAINGTNTETQTNSDGEFAFPLLSAGTYTLIYSYSGYTSQTKQVAVTTVGSVTDAGTIDLTNNVFGNVGGTITLSDTSDYSGILIEVTGTTYNATTLSDGSFIISSIPVGSYIITISKSGYVTENEAISISQGSTTMVTSILYKPLSVVNEYDLGNLGITGTPLSMTYYLGFLYIATDDHLYKINTSSLSIINENNSITNNYISFVGFIDDGVITTMNFLGGMKPGSNGEYFIYSPDLNYYTSGSDNGSVILNAQAVTYYNPGYSITQYNNGYIYMIYPGPIGGGQAPVTYNISSINETNLIGLYYSNDNDTFYACNSSNIYIYSFNGIDFTLEASQPISSTGAGSTCTDIVFDGTYVWTVDSITRKLYKHLNNW